ncbi:unnamed protein product [Bursaphelenchus okinawaensis]|uniref:BPI2 domain-containing protein n=1 Tax=Bursaphelenchus okinawaensis TaxID=465554 RepID=A0A811L5T9_9BILA|nr:unnamed protein product [Bursaphelenchus okinawaensis]CAG9119984.1 unnamed protein product [Bursaphelenchus okinawaensis]
MGSLAFLLLLLISIASATVNQHDLKSYKGYDLVEINDPAEKSAGIYFRISQRGVDYLADLTSDGLPLIFHRMMLPTISESGFKIHDAVITKIVRPDISVKFLKGYGVDISIRMPELEIRGNAELDVLIASYSSQVVALSKNMTVSMRVAIRRNLNEDITNVTVSHCSVNPGALKLDYYGKDASEFYSIGNLIQNGIDSAIKDKICVLPPLVREFLREKIDLLMSRRTPKAEVNPDLAEMTEKEEKSVIDHLCGGLEDDNVYDSDLFDEDEEEPAVSIAHKGHKFVPDLTLRYPPTFSKNDLIFGVDGGVLVNGNPPRNASERPKLGEVTVLRDQMVGLILSEYVSNSLFHQIYDHEMGHVSVVYGIRHIPKVFRPIAKLVCSDCKLLITANLSRVPDSQIDTTGILLKLEGDVSALFFRNNETHNILTTNGVIRVNIKPRFRHSRLFSDVLLAGVDFKVHRAGLSGTMSGLVRKIVTFMIPRAIWPKIQQRLRLAMSYKGVRIPRFCTLELRNLHVDYVKHAAVLSTDFDVDLPLLVSSFKQFVDTATRTTETLDQYREVFRYL